MLNFPPFNANLKNNYLKKIRKKIRKKNKKIYSIDTIEKELKQLTN